MGIKKSSVSRQPNCSSGLPPPWGAHTKLIEEGMVRILERRGPYAEGCADGDRIAVLPLLGHQILNLNLILYIIPLC